jgi:proteasome alpha subunit
MQFYASPEQIMRDRSEFARKNIARGRNVVVLSFEGGVLFVAETSSTTLHKVSEIYDRIGFAAVGRYNEFESLRAVGVRLADLRGYSYDRRDVTGRVIATFFAQTLGSIFTDQTKPYEVEICVAHVGVTPEQDELFRLTYDGSVTDEPGVLAMGGQAETISGGLRTEHRADMKLAEALNLAVKALASVGAGEGQLRTLTAAQLEVAILDRHRAGRTFRRITGAALTGLLAKPTGDGETDGEKPADESPDEGADTAFKGVEPAGSGHIPPAPSDDVPVKEAEPVKEPDAAADADAPAEESGESGSGEGD